jgi:cytoskeletal protein RodZ
MNIELIGERLKKIRQEKGLTLEDLHKKTKVHLNILKAIEGEALTNLSPIYLKGFIKIYCKALGLEPKDYLPDYKESSSNVILGAHKTDDSFLRNLGMKMSFLKK